MAPRGRTGVSSSALKPKALVVARMSPRVNSRTRFLVEILERTFEVTVLSAAPDLAAPSVPQFKSARLVEIPLLLPNKHVWHFLGLVRVVHLNLVALRLLAEDRYAVAVCSDVPYVLAG